MEGSEGGLEPQQQGIKALNPTALEEPRLTNSHVSELRSEPSDKTSILANL